MKSTITASLNSNVAIRVENLSKAFQLFSAPEDRLKQIIFGWYKKYYREFWALNDINFEVKRGGSLGIIGKNGAGKSTLLQILTGTLTPTSGSVEIFGRVAAVLELGAGFNPDFTGRENIHLYASLFGLKSSEIEAKFKEILDFSELHEFIDQPVRVYSSGMQARLAFSVIAHVDADILIIDEALSVGDAFFSQKCMRFLRDFKRTGTVIFVSHDTAAITAYCDDVVWLEGGRIKNTGLAKDVCEEYFSSLYMQTIDHSSEDSSTKLPGNIDLRSTNNNQLKSAKGIIPDLGLQNIHSFGFNFDAMSFGTNDAKIERVDWEGDDGLPLLTCAGGKKVIVRIRILVKKKVTSPIVGFTIKDRLGQHLVGGNTFHSYKNTPLSYGPGDIIVAEFHFKLPILAVGDYSLSTAIASGTLHDHVQLDWIHDAVLFQVNASSIEGVLVGMPLDRVLLDQVLPGGE